MTTYSKHATYQNVSYRPFGVTSYTAGAKSGQVFSIFYPAGTAPAGGWPWVLHAINTTLATSTPDYADASVTTISSTTGSTGLGGAALNGGGVMYQCLLNGIAVVCMQLTTTNTGNAGGTVPTGNGCWHTPGGTSNFYEGLTHNSARKDAILAIQHLRYNASTYSLNKDAWGIVASSGAAETFAWCAFAPSRAYELGTWGPYVEDTVPNVCVLLNAVVTSWTHLDQSIAASPFPDGETSTTIAGTIASAPARYKRDASTTAYLSDIGGECIPPTWYWSNTVSQLATFGLPYPAGTGGTNLHTIWWGLTLKNLVAPGRVYLATGSTGKTSAGGVDMTTAFDRVDMSSSTAPDDDGIADNAQSSDQGLDANTGKRKVGAIEHILANIRKPRWDATIPRRGIGRRGQVNSTGRFVTPPREDGVKTVIVCGGDEPFSPLVVGSGPDTTLVTLAPGESYTIEGCPPVWAAAYGGALAVSRYTVRQYGRA